MGGFWRTSPQTYDFAWGWGSWEVQIPFSIQGPTVKLLIQYRKKAQLHYRLKQKHAQEQHFLKLSHILESLSKVLRQNCENLGEKSNTFSWRPLRRNSDLLMCFSAQVTMVFTPEVLPPEDCCRDPVSFIFPFLLASLPSPPWANPKAETCLSAEQAKPLWASSGMIFRSPA